MAKREKVDGIPTIAMPHVENLTIIRGASGCGKTQKLIDDVRKLLVQGADASSILVLCATPDSARAFSRRLGVAEVRVASARKMALELLAQPGAVALFGHGPRVLLPFEEDILFEDLKTTGVEVGRLAGMLSFFKRSMTEVSDDHPEFLMDDDERAVMKALREGLHLRGAFLEQQLSANADRYLVQGGTPCRYAHVFVDDYQCLSRASQVMAGFLSGESLCVACDPAASDQVLESYPYSRGVGELLEANPQAHILELNEFCGPQSICGALNALRRETGLAPYEFAGSIDTAGCPGIFEVLSDADHEIERAAHLVADSIEEGLAPGDIYVVSPNDNWALRVACALDKRGIGSTVACRWSDLAGSDADTSRNAGYLKVLTAVLLVGDPDDDAAWRSWCAFDEPLAASGEIAIASQMAVATGLRLHEVFARADRAALPRRLNDAYHKGVGLLARVTGAGRDDMFRVLTDELCGFGEPISPALLRLCSGTCPEDDAVAIRAHILDKMASDLGWETAGPRCGSSRDLVHIGEMGRMCGLSPRHVVFTGFVNGFFPQHGFFDQTITPPGDVGKARADCARKLCCALGKAAGSVVFTSFVKIPCSEAEQLGVKIDRIGLEGRTRMARVSPSIFHDCLNGST